MISRRRKQANLFGPAGLVSVDDTEVLRFVQATAESYQERVGLVEFGGHETVDTAHMLSEGQIRAFYKYYREVMQI